MSVDEPRDAARPSWDVLSIPPARAVREPARTCGRSRYCALFRWVKMYEQDRPAKASVILRVRVLVVLELGWRGWRAGHPLNASVSTTDGLECRAVAAFSTAGRTA